MVEPAFQRLHHNTVFVQPLDFLCRTSSGGVICAKPVRAPSLDDADVVLTNDALPAVIHAIKRFEATT